MKKRKNYLFYLLCICLLAGCGSSTSTNEDKPQTVTDEEQELETGNSEQSSEISDLIKKICKEETNTNTLLLNPVYQRRVLGQCALSYQVCGEYLYYGISGLNQESGIYRMRLNEDKVDVEKLMYQETFDLAILPTERVGDIIFTASYDYQMGQGYTGWVEACYYLEDPYGYWAMPFGGSSKMFQGACVIGNYIFATTKSFSGDIFSISRYPIFDDGTGYNYTTILESDSSLAIVGCYDDETFLVRVDGMYGKEDTYLLFDEDGNQLQEITYLNQYEKIFTFGRNKEIAIVRTNADLEERKYGYLLEDGEFVEDEFVKQLFVGRDDFHVDNNYNDFFVDMDFNKGMVYYITSGGNIRSRSLITGEDKFIINDKDAYGLMFCTENYIYYAKYLSNGEIVIYRCKTDGTGKEECTSSMLWKE